MPLLPLFLLLTQTRVNESLMPSGHLIDPYGSWLSVKARPVDTALSTDGKYLLVKQNWGVATVSIADWQVVSERRFASGASMFGILCTAGGKVYHSDARSTIQTGQIAGDGSIAWSEPIAVPKPKVGGDAYPCGMAETPGGGLAVCLSRNNALWLKNGSSESMIPLDPAPFGVAVDGNFAWVTCWGRKPRRHSAMSSDTAVDVDSRGVATGGTIDIVDMGAGKVVKTLPCGLQPSQILIDQGVVYVANANNDTVSVYDLKARRKVIDVVVKPDARLPFGSAPNALAVSRDRNELYVACGGNNAVAVLTLGAQPKIKGFFPTAWYPTALAVSGGQILIACAKGFGSRPDPSAAKFNVHQYSGAIGKAVLPDDPTLQQATQKVLQLGDAPQVLASIARTESISMTPAPVPARLGEPSTIEHVVYVIKENRTYDQVLGDIGRGESDPKLTIYGKEVTPNHHALANEFVLLDNFYCNGVNSADGHSWATEADASSYLERSFGGFTRSYPFGGDDALNSVFSGFLWDGVLAAGKSFRNYGEGDYAALTTRSSWKDLFDARSAGKVPAFKQSIANERLRRYSCRDYPGWNLTIPDQIRADVFLRELKAYEKRGQFPNMTIVYLDQDHTAGLTAGMPTPQAMVADNDLALGRVVDALSHSRFWPKMAIFVIEDDAQDGFDHVDGHRSPCFVVSPFARRGALVSNFYNQAGVVHTMLQTLGVAPLNQMDAMSALLTDCFTSTPDLTPYTVKPNQIPLDQIATPKKATALQRQWMAKSKRLDFSAPDASNEDLLNRMQWISVKGSRPYPTRKTR